MWSKFNCDIKQAFSDVTSGSGMGVVWWLIVGRGSDIMHPGGQWCG